MTCRDCVMRILNAAIHSNLGIIVCFNYLSPSLKALSVKKPVHISESACFIPLLLNLLADLTYLQNGMYTVMDTQCYCGCNSEQNRWKAICDALY